MNNRRKLVIALGAGALAAPLGSFAQQQGKVWRVGFLALRQVAISDSDYYYGPFRQGMRELGYVEGKNLVIEWRSAENKVERLAGLAAELVQLKVDVIVAGSTSPAKAAQNATTIIPIVMVAVGDPVASGLVKSLAHPGGNVTGTTNLIADLAPKYLDLLRSMVPKLSRVAVLLNPDTGASSGAFKNIQVAAQATGFAVVALIVRTPVEIENAFSQMAREKAGALIVMRGPFLNQQRAQIAELAAKHRLPTIAGLGEYVEAGGLMSYGTSLADQSRRAATYIDKIIKGAKPADLPVEQPTKFELVLNGKTAKALGLKIPQSLLIMADKVI
jgi:putative ABC transport system substrate-binding protein